MGRTINIDRLFELSGLSATGIIRERRDFDIAECIELIRRIGETRREGFVIDDRNRFVYEQVARWMIADPAAKANDRNGNIIPADLTRGLYVAGRTGTGKSLLLSVFSVFAKLLQIRYSQNGITKNLDINIHRADYICDDYAREGDLQKYKQAQVLCIEDLGSEDLETLYMGNRRHVIQSILEARGDKHNLLTFATSNVRIDRLGATKEGTERYGDRVQSRAYEMFNYYILPGDDRRK